MDVASFEGRKTSIQTSRGNHNTTRKQPWYFCYDSIALGSAGWRRRRIINSPLLLMKVSAMSCSAGRPYGVFSGWILKEVRPVTKNLNRPFCSLWEYLYGGSFILYQIICRGLITSEINLTSQGAWQISVGCWLQACFYESQVHVPNYKEILIEMDFCVIITWQNAYSES